MGRHAHRVVIYALLGCVLGGIVVGCKSESEEPGYRKEDFGPKPRPEGYGPPKSAPPSPPANPG